MSKTIFFRRNSNIEVFTSNESENKLLSYKHLRRLCTTFILFGINVNYTKKYRSVKIMEWICKSVVIVLFILRTACIFINVCTNAEMLNSTKQKSHLSTYFADFLSVSTWCIVNCSAKKIMVLTNEIISLECPFKNTSHKLLSALCNIWIVFVYISTCVSIIYPYDERKYKGILEMYLFGYDFKNDQFVIFTVCLLCFSCTLFFVTFPSFLTIFYITICHYLWSVICRHRELNLRQLSVQEIDILDIYACFKRYKKITSVLQKFEDTMSLLIFIVFAKSTIGIFNGLICLLKKTCFSSMNSITFWVIHSFIQFSIILIFATLVNEADVNARQTNDEIIERLPASRISVLNMKITLLNKNNKTAFTLTGWKFFSFTRNFFLTSVGCILTYALLIINL